jgi:translocation and assembly module TamA
LSRVSDGYRLGIDLRGATESLASDTSFLQLRINSKWIHSFGSKTRVLARSRLGTTSIDELVELPASVRFFAGGDRSVRGYEYESLGPVDADGNVIGGSHLIDASIEFDYLFKDQWSVGAFVDTGSAFNDDDIHWSTGIGVGIRWYSPVGPIRLDFAHPLDDPENDLRVHISLGPDL